MNSSYLNISVNYLNLNHYYNFCESKFNISAYNFNWERLDHSFKGDSVHTCQPNWALNCAGT